VTLRPLRSALVALVLLAVGPASGELVQVDRPLGGTRLGRIEWLCRPTSIHFSRTDSEETQKDPSNISLESERITRTDTDCASGRRGVCVEHTEQSQATVEFDVSSPGIVGRLTNVGVFVLGVDATGTAELSRVSQVTIQPPGADPMTLTLYGESVPGVDASYVGLLPEQIDYDGAQGFIASVTLFASFPPDSGVETEEPSQCPGAPPARVVTNTGSLGLSGITAVFGIDESAGTTGLTVTPNATNLFAGSTDSFSAWDCPRDANGYPDAGPDGVPGTGDDLCQPANTDWGVRGPIGSMDPTTGSPDTTLTPGADPAAGQVAAVAGEQVGAATVLVGGQLTVHPTALTATAGERFEARAYGCPPDPGGDSDAGRDGIPDTADDHCTPASARWATDAPGSDIPTGLFHAGAALINELVPDRRGRAAGSNRQTVHTLTARFAGEEATAEIIQRADDVLSSAARACASAYPGAVRSVLKAAAGKSLARCQNDLIAPADLASCLAADPSGALAKADAKARSQLAKKCGGTDRQDQERTPLGLVSDPDTTAVAGAAASDAVARALFGPALDGAIPAGQDKDAAGCQRKVAKAAARCADAAARETQRCVSSALRAGRDPFPGGARRPEELAACILADLRGKVAKACDQPAGRPDKLRKALAKCESRGVDLAATFPHCAAADAESVHACLEPAVACAVCRALEAAQGAWTDCDLLDDLDRNGSCAPLL
jgi:hypothetical protein